VLDAVIYDMFLISISIKSVSAPPLLLTKLLVSTWHQPPKKRSLLHSAGWKVTTGNMR